MYTLFLKRLIDIVASILLLVISSPLLAIGIFLAYIDHRENPFFLQKRIGLHGKEFTIFKIRTLRSAPASQVVVHHKPDSPGISMIARFLRSSGLDELPQLVNILKGDMSLIGPRPHALNFAKHYAAVHPKYYDRHRVRPGLACIVEVTALHYLTEQDKHIKLRVDCDLYYVRHQSFLMDARICIKLARYVLRSLMASLAHAKPHLKKHLHSKAQDVLQAPVFDAKAHTPEVQHAFVARPRKH